MKTKTLHKLSPSDTRNTIMLVGMPGIALVGKLAVNTLAKDIKAKKIMEIYPPDIPPRVAVDRNGFPHFLKVNVYHLDDKKNDRDLLLLIGDAQPQTMEGQYEFSKFVCEFAKKYKTKMLIACAASVTPYMEKKPRAHIAGTSKEILELFSKNDNVNLFRQGAITGSNGLIPTMSGRFYGVDGACLLADTTRMVEQVFSIDPRASKLILEVLQKTLNIECDPSILDQKINELDELLATLKKRAEKSKPGQERKDQGPSFIT